MHLRALKKTKKDVSPHDPIGQDKEGNEISLIDVLKSESDDVIDMIQLNMELEKIKEYIDILDDREKEVIVSTSVWICRMKKPSEKLQKN